ncbi:hypothetical protein D6C98_10759 [Aureobasidium pullulans]|nr:hypothetical protein D6C98_10759 [Aureobasidium pullulans]
MWISCLHVWNQGADTRNSLLDVPLSSSGDLLPCRLGTFKLPRGRDDEISIEIGWDLQSCRHAETLENLLASENWKILGHRQGIARRIETVYQSAGW